MEQKKREVLLMSVDALDRELIADDIEAYLKQHEEKDLLLLHYLWQCR